MPPLENSLIWDGPTITSNPIPEGMSLNDFPSEFYRSKRAEVSPAITTLRQAIAVGNYDDNLLQAVGVSIAQRIANEYRVEISRCSGCRELSFIQNLKNVYCGLQYVCKECLKQYKYCSDCESYKLINDDTTHIHVPQLRPRDNEERAYNDNIFHVLGKHFYTSPEDRRPRYRQETFIGIELEVERDHTKLLPPDLVAKSIHALGKEFAIVQHDGSLQAAPGSTRNGSNGFEIVTLPATKRYHYTIADWPRLFLTLVPYCQERPATAGLHIHLNSSALTKRAVGAIVKFTNDPSNLPFLVAIADRDFTKPNPVTGRTYAPLTDAKASDPVAKRKHREGCIMSPTAKVIRQYYLKSNRPEFDYFGHPLIVSLGNDSSVRTCNCPEGHYNYPNHYAAFNLLTKNPTVEFRIFQGSMDIVHFYACIDFSLALVDFCESTSFSNLKSGNFIEWFKINRPHYPKLAKWMVILGMIEPLKGKKKSV